MLRAIAIVVWLAVVLQIFGLAQPMLDALDAIAITFGGTRISLLALAQGVMTLSIAIVVTLWASRLAENKVMGLAAVDVTMRVMLSKLLRAIVLFVALLIALPMLGIDLTALSVFSGALGVGLGLGLQKIASNYLSGFIILLDRSVRIGDVITVGGRSGAVTKMTSRFIVVRGIDGTEALIPNDELITHIVVNQTYSDRQTRAAIVVVVAANADVDQALAAMLQVAEAHPRVLEQPMPTATVKGWTDRGIELELGVWFIHPAGAVAAELRLSVWRALRAHGIEFAAAVRGVLPELGKTPSDSNT